MLRLIPRSIARSVMAALLVASMFSLAAPKAAAADRPSDPARGAPRETRTATGAAEAAKGEAPASAEVKPPNVLYVAFDAIGTIPVPVEPAPEPAARPRRVSALVENPEPPGLPLPTPAPQKSSGVISTAPMTAGEKFQAWFHRFRAPGTYGSAVLNGVWAELGDNDDFKKDTVENFFADTMTRAARSLLSSTTSNFYEKALLASLFRQDPRYHRSGKNGAGAKIGYALTRVFITQGDRCECHQFNASFLLGAAGAAATSVAWERSERGGPFHIAKRFYTHVYLTAFFNVVREFVGGQ